MKNNSVILFAISSLLFMGSCKKDKEETVKPKLNIPSSYDGSNFAANTVTQNAIVTQLSALSNEAKKGRNASNTVLKTELENIFSANIIGASSSTSLQAEATNYFRERLTGDNAWFDELSKASGNVWSPQAPDGTSQGGVYGGYLFDEYGVEIEQIIEKGQFNATLYNHATKIMSSPITLASVDQLLAIFGAKPEFANSGSNNVSAEIRDQAMANYGARRDKNDGNGMYSQIKTAFITLQAAVKQGSSFNAEKDKALKDIQLLWEKINAATIINYCHSPISALSQTNPSESQIGGALHAVGEGIGFIQGFKTINPQYRKITDSEIDEILSLFNAPDNANASVYKFATESAVELPKLQQAISKLQSIYGFSNQEIEEFKTNWVSLQSR